MASQRTFLSRCFLLATMMAASEVLAQNACDDQPNNANISDPEQCQMYYTCFDFAKKSMEECPYPQLFDTETKRCKNYDEVNCQDRVEYVDPCDYQVNQCERISCIPCRVRYSSCVGLPDGPNAHTGRPRWSPNFVLCRDQRTFYTDLACPFDMIFDPDQKRCLHWFEVPVEHRGYYMRCDRVPDGLYPHNTREDVYFVCVNGQLIYIGNCPESYAFNSTTMTCE